MKIIKCPNCGSNNTGISVGAMFECVSIFCKDCLCAGKSSDTKPKQNDYKIREKQAVENWNNKEVEL